MNELCVLGGTQRRGVVAAHGDGGAEMLDSRHLLVSGLRTPKSSEFYEKRNENAKTRFAQTVCHFRFNVKFGALRISKSLQMQMPGVQHLCPTIPVSGNHPSSLLILWLSKFG